MKTINYAIIGFGLIAETRIAREGFRVDTSRFEKSPDYELVGVTDLNPARREAARALGLKWYDSVEAVYQDGNLDAVYIATNNLSHYPLCLAALEAGKHCIVEKPMATSLEHARALSQLAQERGLSLAVDHMMTHNSYNIKARELVRSGDIGEVNDICMHMEFLLGATPEQARAWRCVDPDELGGPIGDVGSHCLYMAEFLLDTSIRSLACTYLPKTLGITVEEGAFIQFTTTSPMSPQSGMNGTARVAFNQIRGNDEATFLNTGYEIYGSQGVIRSYGTMYQLSGHPDEPVDIRIEVDRYKTNEVVRLEDVENIYQAVITDHVESIRHKQPAHGSEGIHNLQLVLACHASAKNDCAVIDVEYR